MIRCIRFRPHQKNTLKGFCDLELTNTGLVIHDCTWHEKDGKAPHWFTLMKQLTLFGFFTSEPGATKVARYRPIPGKYKGVVDYKGEAFWAWA